MNRNTIKICLIGFVLIFTGWQIAGTGSQNVKDFTNSSGIHMIRIESGTFKMGNPDPAVDCWDELPVHQVTLSRDFFMSETEVTLEQFRRFRPGHQDASDGGSVTGVTWHDAAAFCEWLSKKEGKPYRLPTEAEWEYSARAGTDSPFWSGENPPEPGSPNSWGLKNIHSDAAEWCLDWYGPYPEGSVQIRKAWNPEWSKSSGAAVWIKRIPFMHGP